MTEDELIAALFAPLAGPGGFGLKDDAAIVPIGANEDLVTTVDALVAGVHFFPDDPPASIAEKSLGVNLSDLAAKAAAPAGFLLALALPAESDDAWLRDFARGLGMASTRHACPLLGGDTVRTPGPLTVSITAFGTVPRGAMLPRTGLEPGDHVYVSGTIGDAALGLRLRDAARSGQAPPADGGLSPSARRLLVDRYLHPQPRLALLPALRAHAHAGMDVSDGLVGDLRKMLAVSGVSATVRLDAVPLSPGAREAIAHDVGTWETVLTGGDDYELLLGVSPGHASAFEAAAAAVGVAVTRIADVREPGVEATWLQPDGAHINLARGSFQHF